MGGDALTFKLFGLTFNTTNIVSGLIIYAIVFFTLYGMSRKIKMKPTGAQNVFEWNCAESDAGSRAGTL